MIHTGHNEIGGVSVEVVRKRCRRINIRIGNDGTVNVSVPIWWATLREAEAFLAEKWRWVQKVRAETLARAAMTIEPLSEGELLALRALLEELQSTWSVRLDETAVTWKLRKMKSVWGSCHWQKRCITYSTELARAPRELVEYVVVHELTHLAVHNHGPEFYRLMDERLPEWKIRRRRLHRREYDILSTLST